jgi:RNA polymerase sigma-70 factor (ECF subfamily)
MVATTDGQELWRKLRRGDVAAFENFYRSQVGRLQNFLRRYLGDARAAEDVAQEAFLQLWRKPNGFNPARATLKAYLFGIAAKRGADWWRRQAKHVSQPLPTPVASGGAPRILMGDALERLEPEARSLLWLREVEGYSYTELAEIIDIPLGTVRSRLFTAREELRRIWKGEGS